MISQTHGGSARQDGRVAPLSIEHSYLPRWSRLVEQGKERQ